MPFIIIFLITIVHAQGWNKANDPYRMNMNYKNVYEQLPLAGQLKDRRKGWPSNHWSNYQGGIAHRWSSADYNSFTYSLKPLQKLLTMEPHELNELSPSEKFDIFKGRYDYPLTKKVLSEVSPDENKWHGICHGVAPASLNHSEPKSIMVTNPDGLSFMFYSSDISALMSYYYARIASSKVVLIGKRCNSYSRLNKSSPCEDINPGSFHIVLSNRLGILGEGFISDIDRFGEVWNHVAVHFSSSSISGNPPSKQSALGTVKRIRMESLVTYAGAIAPKFTSVIGTNLAEYVNHTYEYYLDINERGEILGGEWLGEKRPDFVWIQKESEYKGDWQDLNKIYHPIDLGQDQIASLPQSKSK